MSARDKLVAAFRAARKVRIGDVLHITTDAGMDAKIEAALNRGETVVENGVTRWISENYVQNLGKTGSARYVWHKDGNRVKTERVLMTKVTGSVTSKPLGFVWRKFQ